MREFLTRFCIPITIPGITLALICKLYSNNTILALAAFALFMVTVLYRKSRFKASMALFAIIFGTFGEFMCCRSYLWVYKYPTAYNLPVWIPFIWPILLINLWEATTYILDLLKKTPKALRISLLVILSVVILGYIIFTVYYLQNLVALILLGFLLIVVAFAREPINIWLFVAVAAGGFFGEYVCVKYGVWFYARPVFTSIGMPLSLPMAWGVSGNVVWLCAKKIPVFGRVGH